MKGNRCVLAFLLLASCILISGCAEREDTEPVVYDEVDVAVVSAVGAKNGSFEGIEVLVKSSAHASPLQFKDMAVSLDYGNRTQSFRYLEDSDHSTDSGKYTVGYVRKGTDNKEGYLSAGDLASINFSSSTGITGGERLNISITTSAGAKSTVNIRVPKELSSEKIILFP